MLSPEELQAVQEIAAKAATQAAQLAGAAAAKEATERILTARGASPTEEEFAALWQQIDEPMSSPNKRERSYQDEPGVRPPFPWSMAEGSTTWSGKMNPELIGEEFLPVFEVQAEDIVLPRNVQSVLQWGEALVMHGKKYSGKKYKEAAKDMQYVTWCRSQKEPSPALRDFVNYTYKAEKDNQSSATGSADAGPGPDGARQSRRGSSRRG